MDCFTEIEAAYHAAKARLQAAPQESEAAAEFLAARDALHQALEILWPSPCPCEPKSGYDKPTYG